MNIIDRLKGNKFFKSTATLASGNILAQAISVFTVPIISRLYSPQTFGEYGVVVSAAAIVMAFSTLGLSAAIMVPDDELQTKVVFFTASITQVVIAALVFLIMLLLMPVYRFFNTTIPYLQACFLMFIYMIVTTFAQLLQVYLNKKELYRVLFWNTIIGSSATLVINIPMGIMGFGVIGFFAASVVSSVVASILMIIKVKPFLRTIRFRDIIGVYKKYKDFLLFQCPANTLTTISTQLPKQMFSNMFGNSALGDYEMTQNLMGHPSRLIAAPIATVYFKTASQSYKEGKNIADFTFSLIKKIMLIAFIPLLIIIIFGKPLFGFILGQSWQSVGDTAGVLGSLYLLLFCNVCVLYCRVAMNRQKENLVMSVISIAIIACSISVGAFWFRSYFATLICFAIGSSAYQIIDMTVNFYCMGKNACKYLGFALSYFAVLLILGFGAKTLFGTFA